MSVVRRRRRIWRNRVYVPANTSIPDNAYVAEDGVTAYVAEDGVTYYVQES